MPTSRREDPEREWQRLVAQRGIAGTAKLLMQMQADLDQLDAECQKLSELVAQSADSRKLLELQQENSRLRELLQGGTLVVTPEQPHEAQ